MGNKVPFTLFNLIGCDANPTPTQEYPGDFEQYLRLGRSLSNQEKLQALQSHFIPTAAFKFPVHEEYGKKRSFQLSWLKDHKWLVYSPKVDGAYCKECALFGASTIEKNSNKIDKLAKSPVTFWTTAGITKLNLLV